MVVKTAKVVVAVAVAAAKARPLFTERVNREDLLVRNFLSPYIDNILYKANPVINKRQTKLEGL